MQLEVKTTLRDGPPARQCTLWCVDWCCSPWCICKALPHKMREKRRRRGGELFWLLVLCCVVWWIWDVDILHISFIFNAFKKFKQPTQLTVFQRGNQSITHHNKTKITLFSYIHTHTQLLVHLAESFPIPRIWSWSSTQTQPVGPKTTSRMSCWRYVHQTQWWCIAKPFHCCDLIWLIDWMIGWLTMGPPNGVIDVNALSTPE